MTRVEEKILEGASGDFDFCFNERVWDLMVFLIEMLEWQNIQLLQRGNPRGAKEDVKLGN